MKRWRPNVESLEEISGYRWPNAALTDAHKCLVPPLVSILTDLEAKGVGGRLMDLGCGNGSITKLLYDRGYNVLGIDPSAEGVAIARSHYPSLPIEQGSAYEDLPARFGHFDIVLSLEVVEHLYNPRKFASTIYDLLDPGGYVIISTPYHGYWKNLAIAISGRFDWHFTALWDHGHIKFYSLATLGRLLYDAKFRGIQFRRVGRIPQLAKSLIAVAQK